MYGAILRKGEEYCTHLYRIFIGINMVQKDYNWLITDIVAYPKTKEYQDLFSKEYCWLSGEELTNIIEKEDFQWIWGVLSGFEKSIDIPTFLAETTAPSACPWQTGNRICGDNYVN